MRKTKLNQAGDTIVEVLLAVVVVGLAVGLGYGVASRGLKANRQAQERVEALKQVESQTERLKKLATTDTGEGADTIFRSGAFCLVGDGVIVAEDTPPTDLADDPLNNTVYNSACIQGLYHLSITPTETGPNVKEFSIKARWFGLGGQDKEESVINYRVYPAAPSS